MKCPHCGQALPEGTRFCKFCGNEVQSQSSSPPTGEPPLPAAPEVGVAVPLVGAAKKG